jgi:FMN-dependent oxidoreductase (nitrilotriacetate monooxygenase family)
MKTYLGVPVGCPRSDPTALVAVLGYATQRIGLIASMSTSFYPPFMAARMLATLDQISMGRAGGNFVTSSNHRAANNFGLDRHIEHDLRYEMADEWTQVVSRLLASWEPGAVLCDTEAGIFADYEKVHPINFEGRFFKCRGPLNTPPGPQGRPVICQAGGSGAGRAFAAKHADTIIAVPLGLDDMKAYKADIVGRMIEYGRDPHACKVLYLVSPVIAETDAAAERLFEEKREARRSGGNIDAALAEMSYFSGIDFAKFDLDAPLPELGKVDGHQSAMARFAKDTRFKTLRELALGQEVLESVRLVGSPETVAARMGEVMEHVGGDGFLISSDIDRRTVATISDGLVPALQKKGLTRTKYEFEHFKSNLMAF